MVRARAAFTAALADVWAAITGIHQFHSFLNHLHLQSAPSTFVGDFQSLQALAALGALYTAVALIYHRLHQGDQAEADGRLSDFVTFVLVAAAGSLVQRAGGAEAGVVDAARKLGVAALSVLPAAATLTFFLGMMLLILLVAHVRAGDDEGDLEIQGPVALLTWMAFGAVAGLVGLMAMAFYVIKL